MLKILFLLPTLAFAGHIDKVGWIESDPLDAMHGAVLYAESICDSRFYGAPTVSEKVGDWTVTQTEDGRFYAVAAFKCTPLGF